MSEYLYKGINVKETPGGLELTGVSDFVPSHTFGCGQCFRWRREDEESYDGVAMGRHARVSALRDGRLELAGATRRDLTECWYDYLDLGTDYGAIKAAVADDDVMRQATAYGSGIHLLRQDLAETVISFIISANNNIPRISGTVERISDRWGDPLPGTARRTFPGAETLASVCEGDLRECGAGFRDRYICGTARRLASPGALSDLGHRLSGCRRDEAARLLMTLPGVGPKVADCILLFSGARFDVFPKDVWVFRAMGRLYPDCGRRPADIDGFVCERFGMLTGYAQQYLFYWARANL